MSKVILFYIIFNYFQNNSCRFKKKHYKFRIYKLNLNTYQKIKPKDKKK